MKRVSCFFLGTAKLVTVLVARSTFWATSSVESWRIPLFQWVGS